MVSGAGKAVVDQRPREYHATQDSNGNATSIDKNVMDSDENDVAEALSVAIGKTSDVERHFFRMRYVHGMS
ncbi:MAG: hypothetical protein ACOCWQ_04025 [Nanoarchaeota archaeon]